MTDKKRFSKKIAREVAEKSFDQMLDCVLERQDPDYSIMRKGEDFEQNFEEDLEEIGINPTFAKIKIISDYYDKKHAKLIATIERFYSK